MIDRPNRRILFVSPRQEAEPLLANLRSAGYDVSLVEETEQAQALLSSGGFEQSVVSAPTMELLLRQRLLWEHVDSDAWRRSAASVAHDIRNLLTSLDQKLRETETPLGDDPREQHRSIHLLSTFLLELTDELEYAASPQLKIDLVDLEDAIETAAVAVYPSARERSQRLVIDIEESAGQIDADGTKIRRILTNLLQHASGQSPRRGTVRVRARSEPDGSLLSVSYEADATSVSQFGELFRPPHQGSPQGALYRVQHLVGQHGGRLWIESERGSGSTIFVLLPGRVRTGNAITLTPG